MAGVEAAPARYATSILFCLRSLHQQEATAQPHGRPPASTAAIGAPFLEKHAKMAAVPQGGALFGELFRPDLFGTGCRAATYAQSR